MKASHKYYHKGNFELFSTFLLSHLFLQYFWVVPNILNKLIGNLRKYQNT